MSTTTTRPMTAEEFFEWSQHPDNRERNVELERGEIVEMSPPGKSHGFVCANIAGILRQYASRQAKGYVCTNDSGLLVEQSPDTVRGPDVTYYDDAQTAETPAQPVRPVGTKGFDCLREKFAQAANSFIVRSMERQFATTPPLLAIEVLSPHDRINQTVFRVTQLLRFGVRLVWVVDPEARDVSAYRLGRDPELFRDSQPITDDEVLPGFRCLVSELFDLPGKAAPSSNA